ncbi:MAG TPA: molybdopterin molybdotransferase MoeA [Candidatus Acidoferrales bacterium]|nr:molybdopterin molybdotransferase MoeA [Candidatus Acidoferrales bacterium]
MKRPDIKRMPKRGNPIEAQRQLLEAARKNKPHSEIILLTEALGRVLAKDVFSEVNIPAYDKTFIDGYAINTKETKDASVNAPATFKIIGKLFPVDYPPALTVGAGQAVYVACGAPIPEGADSTVKVEETRLSGDQIQVLRPIKLGEGIIPLGDDVKKGDLILGKGTVLRPQDVGLLASIGLKETEVFKKPTVAILSGGDELIRQCQKNPERIANNYALVVAGLASELGASAQMLGIMPDSLEKVTAEISEALAQADIVVTIGGSSVGVKDFVPDAVNSLGKPGVIVQGILLRPGAVSGFGTVNGKPVIMLPGHIGSCIAGFYLFAAPLISQYTGLKEEMQPRLTAELTETLDSGPQFRFQLLKLTQSEGKFLAEPVEGGSSALSTIVKSNGYAIVPPHSTIAKNSKVEVTLFGKQELAVFGV